MEVSKIILLFIARGVVDEHAAVPIQASHNFPASFFLFFILFFPIVDSAWRQAPRTSHTHTHTLTSRSSPRPHDHPLTPVGRVAVVVRRHTHAHRQIGALLPTTPPKCVNHLLGRTVIRHMIGPIQLLISKKKSEHHIHISALMSLPPTSSSIISSPKLNLLFIFSPYFSICHRQRRVLQKHKSLLLYPGPAQRT